MNHLTIRENNPVDIDPNDVLRDYGLDTASQTSTVVQQGNTIINIPNDSPLEPPAISMDNHSEEDLNNMADELFGSTDAIQAVQAVNDDDYPDENPDEDLDDAFPNWNENQGEGHDIEVERDLDAEEDEDWDNLEEAGIIRRVDNTTNVPNADSQVHFHMPDGEIVDVPVINETSLDTQEDSTSQTPMTIEEAVDLLPVNSKSHEIDETTSRFSGAAWYHAVQQSNIILAGLGGIGSYVLFCLSRMKPAQIFLYDDDVVELANLSGQLYNSSMVGKHKVNAMAELARDFSLYYGVQAVPQKFTMETAAGDIMICGFDNMEARKTFFNVWVNHLVNHPHPEKCLFIDGRLSMEEFQVFCMRGDDVFNIKRYTKEYLFEDYQAESIQCSLKQTTYCANMIGSVMVNLFTNFVANTLKPLIDRDLPFKTYYDASMMYFKTET